MVEDVELEKNNDVLIKVYSGEDASVEVERARERARLFEKVLSAKVEVRQVPR